jgi:hypothetical protein
MGAFDGLRIPYDHTTDGEKINQIHIFNIPDDGRNEINE